jgi:hypothetical protein
MIERHGNEYALTCDICECGAGKLFDGFGQAVQYKIDNGWLNLKKDDDWWEHCPSCYEKNRKAFEKQEKQRLLRKFKYLLKKEA